MNAKVKLLWLQGIFYIVTGIWPLLHLASFMYVTGPKHDTWLVKTVGLLILVIGLVYLVAAYRKEFNTSLGVLAVGAPLSLMGVDIYYASQDIIADIYLADAVAEGMLILAWAWVLVKQKAII